MGEAGADPGLEERGVPGREERGVKDGDDVLDGVVKSGTTFTVVGGEALLDGGNSGVTITGVMEQL